VIGRSQVRLPAGALLASNSGQVVHTHEPLSPSSIIWYQPRGGDVLQLGRLTAGLASHWPCVTDSVVYPPTGSKANVGEMSTPPTLQQEYGPLCLLPLCLHADHGRTSTPS